MPINNKRYKKIQERITNLSNLGYIPADEAQLNIDTVYNSILDEVCAVVPMNSYRQVISALRLIYGSKQKSIKDSKDVYRSNMMNITGAIQPLDEEGYPTNEVMFQMPQDGGAEVVGNYKNIIPNTLKVIDVTSGNILAHDNGNGILIGTSETDIKGTVNYETAEISSTEQGYIKYKFDIYNLETSRNFVAFQKTFIETFADQFQLDLDTAIVLNEFKGIDLKQNIEKILPEVLAQQIDNFVLNKYFNQLNISSTITNEFDSTQPFNPIDIDKVIGNQMSEFTAETGVVPNVILADPKALNILRLAKNYVPISMLKIDKEYETNIKYSGTPRFAGYFDTCIVFLVNNTNKIENEGRLVITYRGPSEAESAIVYSPFIPVTLRQVNGMEGGGMIQTNNIYSIGGSTIINPELIQGIKIKV